MLVAFTFGDERRDFVVSLDLVARTAASRARRPTSAPLADYPGRWSPEGGVELAA